MMIKKIKLPVDSTRIPSGVPKLKTVTSLNISKDELFMLGIFKHEVPPEHVGDNEYFYLASKIPAYVQLYDDFIEVENGSIVNKSTDDRVMKDISEIVGIALGIKYSTQVFGFEHQKISKILAPKKKQKYLDYQFTLNGKLYELETKGTTNKNLRSFVDDILEKKKSSTTAYLRYGTVALLVKPSSSHQSQLHICDDPPEDSLEEMPDEDMPWHYIYALGYLLDNKYYNKYQKFLSEEQTTENKLSKSFFGKYIFKKQTYFGEFFDYRLNIENLSQVITGRENSINEVFNKATRAQGKVKIFIGIDQRIIDLIEKGQGLSEILDLDLNKDVTSGSAGQKIILGSDGVIVVLCKKNKDSQVENQFTETEVKRRMDHLFNYVRQAPEACGMPCRSREKQGKSCEIKTYRGACHFHR